MKRYYKFSTVLLIICTFIFITLFSTLANESYEDIDMEITPTHKFFENEESYNNYIINNIKFDNLEFSKIKIEKGDNFWKIAKNHSINIDTLLSANPYWESLFARINQEIVVPNQKGSLHFIKELDEIDQLAKFYGVKKESISVQKLPYFYAYYSKFIKQDKPIAVFVDKVKPTNKIMTDVMAKKFAVREMFRSPLGGRFSSFYGMRKHPIFKRRKLHNGIDIAAKWGTPIGAACSGTVIFTGWRGGYGKAVIIQHKNGYKTLYGHMSSIATRRGRKVRAGQFVGRVGSTGNSTGPHLHFTLWKNNKLINPMKILW